MNSEFRTRSRRLSWVFVIGSLVLAILCVVMAIIAEIQSRRSAVETHVAKMLVGLPEALPGTAEHAAQQFYLAVTGNSPEAAFRMTSARFQSLVNERAFAKLCGLASGARLRGAELPLDGSRTLGAGEFAFGRTIGGGPELIVTAVHENERWLVDSIVLRPNAIE